MTCQQTSYSITVDGSTPVDPQDLSFELHSQITVGFVAPSGYTIGTITFTPNPPTTGPTPMVATASITFSNPDFATVDFDVNVPVTATQATLDGEHVHPFEGPTTTVKFKPRTRCPT